MKNAGLLFVVGLVAIGAYLAINATSQPTNATGSGCAGDWTDNINPVCWITGAQASASDAVNTVTNEANTILIIIAAVVVLVVALLAFGPQTGALAGTAARFAL